MMFEARQLWLWNDNVSWESIDCPVLAASEKHHGNCLKYKWKKNRTLTFLQLRETSSYLGHFTELLSIWKAWTGEIDQWAPSLNARDSHVTCRKIGELGVWIGDPVFPLTHVLSQAWVCQPDALVTGGRCAREDMLHTTRRKLNIKHGCVCRVLGQSKTPCESVY